MTSLSLDDLCKDHVSKYGHILGCWGVGLQHELGAMQLIPKYLPLPYFLDLAFFVYLSCFLSPPLKHELHVEGTLFIYCYIPLVYNTAW